MSLRVVVMGVSGCGKSTVGAALAERLALPYAEGDTLHPPRNVELMRGGTPLTDDDRRGWLDAVAAVLAAAAAPAPGIVVSCSALKRAYRDRLRLAAPDLRFVHLHGDAALLDRRLRARPGHYMPPSLLASQLQALEPPRADEDAVSLDIAQPADALVAEAAARLSAVAVRKARCG